MASFPVTCPCCSSPEGKEAFVRDCLQTTNVLINEDIRHSNLYIHRSLLDIFLIEIDKSKIKDGESQIV